MIAEAAMPDTPRHRAEVPGIEPAQLFPQRLETDAESVERDLLKLVLTVVDLVRQLMEKQALRRVDEGDLTPEQIEGLGAGLMHLEEAMDDLKTRYDLTAADLNIDLGPLGTLLSE
jgi:Gas vesicle protein K